MICLITFNWKNNNGTNKIEASPKIRVYNCKMYIQLQYN